MRNFIGLFVVIGLLAGCTKDKMPRLVELDNQLRLNIQAVSPDNTVDYYIIDDENDLANIPADPLNPLTREKVELGKLMFYETGLGVDSKFEFGSGTYSCATCHIPEAGFRPGTFQGIADGGEGFGVNGEDRTKHPSYQPEDLDIQSARPLSLVNVAYVTNTFWNGAFGATGANIGTEHLWNEEDGTHFNHTGHLGIEAQNMEGLHVHRIRIDEEILDQYGYTKLFDEAFPDIPATERYTQATASLAYSAYIRTILSTKAPFQNWLKGDSYAMSFEQKQGAILFFGKAQCYQCHYEENLGSTEFHALGVNDMFMRPSFNTSPSDKRNLGRGGFTLNAEDNYKFKVPGIYNMSDTPFYFHGSSKESLYDLVEYKDKAIKENPNVPDSQMSDKFNPVNLTEEEKGYLVDFLAEGLRDPDLTRYAPTSLPSGLCFPNNDPQSRLDLGCD